MEIKQDMDFRDLENNCWGQAVDILKEISDADKEDATSIGFTTDIKDELTSDAVNVKKFAVGGIYVNGK